MFEIKITGGGTPKEVVAALRVIANQIENLDYLDGLAEKGEVEWEDSVLFTEIKEADESE